MKRLAVALLSLALAAMLLGVACGDDGGDEEAGVEAAIQAGFDRWNAADVEGLVAGFTDAGLINVFGTEGMSVEDVKARLAPFVGERRITNVEFSNTTVDGDTATSDVQAVSGLVLFAQRRTLVREDGVWKVDDEENIVVEIPGGTETIAAETFEFGFNIDTEALAAATGAVAIAIDNIGTQPHELAIVRVPAGADLPALFASEEAEIELIGVEGPLEPGESLNIVFTQALEPGSYAIVCFLPDITEGPDGTPHAFKGMLAEFTK
jgi:hypothetical protein